LSDPVTSCAFSKQHSKTVYSHQLPAASAHLAQNSNCITMPLTSLTIWYDKKTDERGQGQINLPVSSYVSLESRLEGISILTIHCGPI